MKCSEEELDIIEEALITEIHWLGNDIENLNRRGIDSSSRQADLKLAMELIEKIDKEKS